MHVHSTHKHRNESNRVRPSRWVCSSIGGGRHETTNCGPHKARGRRLITKKGGKAARPLPHWGGHGGGRRQGGKGAPDIQSIKFSVITCSLVRRLQPP